MLCLLPVLFVVCQSAPAIIEEMPEIAEFEFISPEPEDTEPVYNDISQEMYDNTLTEVRQFIESLNTTIRNRSFANWRGALSDDYYARISSPEFLASASDSPALRARQIVLRSVNDYFTHVVIPSRANSRIDEIEFSTENIVKAYQTDDARRLRLYELEKTDGEWKIIN